MPWKRIIAAGVIIGILLVIYNFFVFYVFNFYPDFEFDFLNLPPIWLYFIIFVRGVFVGMLLTLLFEEGIKKIDDSGDSGIKVLWGVLYFTLYAVVALFAFGITDMFLLNTPEGMFVMFTIDGLIETTIVTMSMKFFL